MTNNRTLHIILCVLAASLFFAAGIAVKSCRGTHDGKVTVVRHTTDTVVVRKTDSVFVERVRQLPGRVDTMFVFNGTDTLYLSGIAYDTIYIDSIVMRLVTQDTIIRDTVLLERVVEAKRKRFGFGVTAGVGATYGVINRKFDLGPTVGLGFTYKF